jgi:DNA end-binding protein Ku
VAHPIWTGTVSFGLVAIPVSLVSAIKPSRVSFHLLHDHDFGRLRREMVCPEHEIAIPPDQWVRGHEEQPGKYVTISAEEIRSIAPKRSQTIEILDFVDIGQIPPLYYKKAYYLLPSGGGALKAYRLLAQALSEQNRAGIAQFVMRERELLVAIRAIEEMLCLFALYYYDEVTENLKPGPIQLTQIDQLGDLTAEKAVDSEEIKTIKRTIQQMSTQEVFASFPWEQIADAATQEQKLRDAIERKKQSGDVVQVPESAEDISEGISEDTLDEAGDLLRVLELHLEREKMQEKH